MQALNLPAFDIKIKEGEGVWYVWDTIRSKDLVLTPEEWVRQHVVNFLVNHRSYPKGRIALENGVVSHGIPGRSDVVFFDAHLRPFLLVECKAPTIKLSQRDVEQLGRYNLKYQAPYIMVTNGMQHHIFALDFQTKRIQPISDVPSPQ